MLQLEARLSDTDARGEDCTDMYWMRRALRLAEEVRGHVWPNPPVGCVILNNGAVVGEAATHPGGRPHAERRALDQAGTAAAGATLYVTLEPCCHFGKTAPCTDAIIAARVSRVVCAIQDPDPRVNGGGFSKLRAAGIQLLTGPGAQEAERLMSGFFHRVRHGEPELIWVDRDTSAIPEGADAIILPTQRGGRLVTHAANRLRDLAIDGIPPQRLLRHLAGLGLTSVAVSREDPIAHRLAVRSGRPGQGES